MEHDYSLLVENLKGRRYDEALREPVLSEAFDQSNYPDSINYALESMQEIDAAYAYKVYATSRRIHEKIAKELAKRGYDVDYRYQGALKTFSNIRLYGDVEIIVLKKNVSDKPHLDMQSLAGELIDILNGDPNFKTLDYSDKTRIRITAMKPTCEIDILPSIWVNSAEYVKTKNEIYRGIAEFDFKNKKVKKYLPFLNIARINARDLHTNGNFKSISRLLKTLRADSQDKIDLKDSEIYGILYSIPMEQLQIDCKKVLSLLPLVEELLVKLIKDPTFFSGISSPSEKDRVFAGKPEKKIEIQKMHRALKRLIIDLKVDLEKINKRLDSEIEYV
jgi:menaquinone-dependent protoporphyrinogen IX oxidase